MGHSYYAVHSLTKDSFLQEVKSFLVEKTSISNEFCGVLAFL